MVGSHKMEEKEMIEYKKADLIRDIEALTKQMNTMNKDMQRMLMWAKSGKIEEA